jgi:hypothetical protein
LVAACGEELPLRTEGGDSETRAPALCNVRMVLGEGRGGTAGVKHGGGRGRGANDMTCFRENDRREESGRKVASLGDETGGSAL